MHYFLHQCYIIVFLSLMIPQNLNDKFCSAGPTTVCSKVDKKRCDRVWSVLGLGSGFFFTSGSMRTQVSVFRRGHPLISSQTVLTTFFDFCPFPATFEAVFRGLSKACILRKSSGLSRSKYSSCNALSLKNKEPC